MKKKLTLDRRAGGLLSVWLYLVAAGLVALLFMMQNFPSLAEPEVYVQALYSAAFAADIAVGGALGADIAFRRQE